MNGPVAVHSQTITNVIQKSRCDNKALKLDLS